jgi:hypothetical protein
MSTEKDQVRSFGSSHQGSKNAGSWYGDNKLPLPAPQNFDTFQSYATAQAAHEAAKKRNGG